jgi:hypothetical protein
MLPIRIAMLALPALLSACSSMRETQPPRTADEQLLISSAVDHALERLKLGIPRDTKIWVEEKYFDGFDQKYAVAAIRDYLLRRGGRLVADRGAADTVVEIRAGALSTNSDDMLIGFPSLALPVPLVGNMQTPELSVVKRSEDQGVAKLGLTAYDAKTGQRARFSPAGPTYGYSTNKRWVVLSLFEWTETDTVPKAADEEGERSSKAAR